MLGITFKENCPDIRNTKIIDIITFLEDYGINATIFDPWVNYDEAMKEYNVNCLNVLPKQKFDAIILGVAHNEFLKIDLEIIKKDNAVVYDVKGFLQYEIDGKL